MAAKVRAGICWGCDVEALLYGEGLCWRCELVLEMRQPTWSEVALMQLETAGSELKAFETLFAAVPQMLAEARRRV